MPARSLGRRSSCIRALGGHLVGHLLATLVPRGVGVGLELLDAGPLLGQYLLELLGHLAIGAPEVTTVELLLALEAELVQQVAQTLDLARRPASPTPGSRIRWSASCRSPLASRSSVSCEQDRVGVVDQRLLGPVPLAVVETPGHPRPR